jgi:hypothetical protein
MAVVTRKRSRLQFSDGSDFRVKFRLQGSALGSILLSEDSQT